MGRDKLMDAINQQFDQYLRNPVILNILIIWLIFWKGLALWRSAGKKQLVWFVILLIINTMGILEIAYIIYLNKWSIDNGKILSFLNKKLNKAKR